MKVSVLQMDVKLGDFAANKQTLLRLFEKAMISRPDVVILPEMWNVGFYPEPIAQYADAEGMEIRELLSQLARKSLVNIVGGSVATRHGQHVYNTSYAFNRSGELVSTYHKIHLFSPANEHKVFTAGDALHTYMLDGIKCATVICYDLRFGELIRQLALDQVAVLFIPAAWPAQRLMHWQTLNRARAIENQFFVVGANAADSHQLAGHSLIIDPWGEILAEAGTGEQIVQANLKIPILEHIRKSMDIFADRKPKLYRL